MMHGVVYRVRMLRMLIDACNPMLRPIHVSIIMISGAIYRIVSQTPGIKGVAGYITADTFFDPALSLSLSLSLPPFLLCLLPLASAYAAIAVPQHVICIPLLDNCALMHVL